MRRTQAERRATTRSAILAATMECLVERGYSGTSLAEVVARAELSNGGVWKHFRSKAELMAEVVVYCSEQLTATSSTGGMARQSGDKRVAHAMSQLWSKTREPAFQALLELVRAGRSDPELRVAIRLVDERTGTLFFDTLAAAVGPDIAAGPRFRSHARMLGLSLYGTAVTAGIRSETGDRRLLQEMQQLAIELLVPAQEAAACG